MIAQMQGKIQLSIIKGFGHFVYESETCAEIINQFISRSKPLDITRLKNKA